MLLLVHLAGATEDKDQLKLDPVAKATAPAIASNINSGVTLSMPIDVGRFYEEMAQMKSSIQTVTSELEKFHGFYMKSMESKILQIFTTMTNLDANIKALQERAHVWDVFRHHIDSWTDHMKSVDRKIDLIKR